PAGNSTTRFSTRRRRSSMFIIFFIIFSFIRISIPIPVRKPAGIAMILIIITSQRRRRLTAAFLCLWTTWRERTPTTRSRKVGRLSANGLESLVGRIVQSGDGVEERPGIRHPHPVEKRGGRGLFDDSPCIHHRRFMGSPRHNP